jgi:hypothetical protein
VSYFILSLLQTKRKAGRPKKIAVAPQTPDINRDDDEGPTRDTLCKNITDCGYAEKPDATTTFESGGLAEAFQKVDDNELQGGYKTRKWKLADGDDQEGDSKTWKKKKLADRSVREVESKTRKGKFVDGEGDVGVTRTSTSDSGLEFLRELPQIRKKFPRKRLVEKSRLESDANEQSGQVMEKVDRGCVVDDGSSANSIGEQDDNVAESCPEKEGEKSVKVTMGEITGGGAERIVKRRGRPPKKKMKIDEGVKADVKPGDEVGKKKPGRPKKSKDQLVDPGSTIPDSEVPDWVVQKSMRGGKYNSYNYQQKEDLLNLAEKFGGSAVANKLGIPVSTISCWKRTFKKDTNRDPTTGRKIGSGRKLCYGNEVDELILQWILECRDLHCPTTVDDIGNYAGKIVRSVEGCETFKASHGWVAKFRKRHVAILDGRMALSHKLPPKLENLITQFQKQIHEIRQEYSIDPSLIINMDEVPIYFDLTGKKMKSLVVVKQEVVIRVTIGRKQHLTLLGAVTGEGKGLKPMLVMKGKYCPTSFGKEFKHVPL